MPKKIKVDLDAVIGLCRFCTKPLGESSPPACASCVGLEARRTSTKVNENPNPYKKVWSAPEAEEAELLKWTKNGTLFSPTWEELAKRYESTAHYLLNKARKLGRSVEGMAAFEDALIYQRMVKRCLLSHQELIAKSR